MYSTSFNFQFQLSTSSIVFLRFDVNQQSFWIQLWIIFSMRLDSIPTVLMNGNRVSRIITRSNRFQSKETKWIWASSLKLWGEALYLQSKEYNWSHRWFGDIAGVILLTVDQYLRRDTRLRGGSTHCDCWGHNGGQVKLLLFHGYEVGARTAAVEGTMVAK